MHAGRDESAHTVNAAAVVLAAAARSSTGLRRHNQHHQQLHDHATAVSKRRWWWSWLPKPNLACFRPQGHPRRIANAGDTSPQPAAAHTASAAYVHHATHPPVPPPPAFAFVAPPSSPASSLYASESPSPVLLGLHPSSPSPSRSSMMFAVGPYAEGPQQLVSPPVLYSTFTTEPSTAPRTPPAITNPSSPEVPFARFLASSLSSSSMTVAGGSESGLYFHAYQLQPGSPIPLVSPPGSSSPTPQLFRKKLHRRDEGSLLDGHIPVSTGGGGMDLVVPDTARDEGHGGGEGDDGDGEVPKSGEFVFGSADGPAEDMDGDARKNWHFFPMVEQGMI